MLGHDAVLMADDETAQRCAVVDAVNAACLGKACRTRKEKRGIEKNDACDFCRVKISFEYDSNLCLD